MKKPILFLIIAASFCSVSAFASSTIEQGLFWFSGPHGGVWDNFSSFGTAKLTNDMKVAFLWGHGVPAVAAIATSVATNAGPAGTIPQGIPGAWNAILNDPNYGLATNLQGLVGGSLEVQSVAADGSWSWVTVVKDSASNAFYNVFVIGWDGLYSTPQAAAAAGAAVGWSSWFSYHSGWDSGNGFIHDMASMALAGLIPFGVVPIPPPALSITRSGNSIVISWPASYMGYGYVLQQSQDLPTTNWVGVTNNVDVINSQYTVTVPASANSYFYRLRKP